MTPFFKIAGLKDEETVWPLITASASIISSIQPLIKKGILQDYPPAYYHFAYISFIDGVVDKCADSKYKLDAHTQAELLNFISSIGSSMGRCLKG